MSLVYEVNLRVEAPLAAEYDVWLRAHVDEMLGLPGFLDARIYALDDAGDAGHVTRVVHYQLDAPASFEAYLEAHAARMRGQGLQRFGDKVSATRRLLHPL